MKYFLAFFLLFAAQSVDAQESPVGIDAAVMPNTGNKTVVSQVLFMAEVMPRPGYDFDAYLVDNVQFPVSAKAYGIPGKVTVRFVVNKEGSISDVVVVQSSSNRVYDSDVVRVIKGMPAWKPGRQNGKQVSVYVTKSLIVDLE